MSGEAAGGGRRSFVDHPCLAVAVPQVLAVFGPILHLDWPDRCHGKLKPLSEPLDHLRHYALRLFRLPVCPKPASSVR